MDEDKTKYNKKLKSISNRNLPKEEKMFLILKKIDLKTIPKYTVDYLTKMVLNYLLKKERYEECSTLKTIKDNYDVQLKK